MQLTVIPGVRQDHTGQLYVHVRDEMGNLHQQHVEPLPLAADLQEGMTKVTIESKARPGTYFTSLACYQGYA